MDFVKICNFCARKAIIKAAKRIFNSDKICCSYYDFYFGVTFLEHTVVIQVAHPPFVSAASKCAIEKRARPTAKRLVTVIRAYGGLDEFILT